MNVLPLWMLSDGLLWRLLRAGKTDEVAVDICERAAILQHDAGIGREKAEMLAQESHMGNRRPNLGPHE